MNVDVFLETRQNAWGKLRKLTKKRNLSAAEAEELFTLYRNASRDLSHLRSHSPDPAAIDALSVLVLRARRRLTGSGAGAVSGLRHLVVYALPAAFWRLRWWSLITTLTCVGLAFVAAWWVLETPDAMASLISSKDAEQLVNHKFENYYHEGSAGSFGTLVALNNAWVALLTVAGGMTGIVPAFLLASNSINVGVMGAIMHHYGGAATFWSLITPHGLLELTLIFVAGAAGFRLFWSWFAAGSEPRSVRVARQGREMVTLTIGLAFWMAFSAFTEAVITPSPLPTWARVTYGVFALLAFLAYGGILGRRAEKLGVTGDVVTAEREATVLTDA